MSNLLFSLQFQRWRASIEEHLSELELVNVVLHGSASGGEIRRRHRHNALYGACSSPSFPTCKAILPHSLASCTGPMSHYRIAAGQDASSPRARRGAKAGKYLVFSTGNLIRAGKSTHGHAVLSMYKLWRAFNKTAGLSQARWPSSLNGPNAVVSGAFKYMLSPAIKDDSLCTHTSKFPGIAVRTREHSTPEIYLKRSAFIVSGVTSSDQLERVFKILIALYLKYKTDEPAPRGPLPVYPPKP